MSNNLLDKIRSLRTEATAGHATGSNTKQPIYDRIEQNKVLDRIESTLGGSYSLFWRIGVATGARTSDVCRMTFDDVDLSTGYWTYTVSKQTKSAEAKAYNKTLKLWKERLKRAAMLKGDHQKYMLIDMTDFKNIVEHIHGDSMADFEADLMTAVNNAPVLRDRKKLPAKVIEIIRQRKAKNHHDNYVFSRTMCGSNRAINQGGHITRQAVHKALQGIFKWFKSAVNAALNLSAYSTRKIFAYNMLRGKNGKENNISEVVASLGHSSLQMTKKYLGLSTKADDLQAQLVE